MKQLLLATAFVLATGAVYAADAVQSGEEPPAPLPIASTFNWTGGYIGVNAGGAFGKFKHPFSGFGPTTDLADINASGFLGGVQAGYNWQLGQMVYGIEADFQGSTAKGSVSDASIGLVELSNKVDWFGTLRARVGYTPTDRVMIYGTGGLAYGHVKSELVTDAPFTGSSSKTKAGWTVGTGIEYALGTNWTVKPEYLYTDLGKSTILSSGGASLKNDIAFHTVRVGLNYKF